MSLNMSYDMSGDRSCQADSCRAQHRPREFLNLAQEVEDGTFWHAGSPHQAARGTQHAHRRRRVHRRREVGAAKEQGVNPRHGGDGIDEAERQRVLDLRDHGCSVVGRLDRIRCLQAAIAPNPRRAGKAPPAVAVAKERGNLPRPRFSTDVRRHNSDRITIKHAEQALRP